MKFPHQPYNYLIAGIIAVFLYSCSSAVPVLNLSEMNRSDIPAEQILENLPDYRQTLTAISGSGRAIVSEPNNNERVSLQFQSTREESLIKIRNSLGIEGGQIYVDGDSLLIYNRVEKYAEKVPLHESRLTSIGSIASINILDLLNYTAEPDNVVSVYQNDDYFVLVMENDSYVHIHRDSNSITEVVHATGSDAPYSRIEYEGYSDVNGFQLPGRITIYSREGDSRAALLVQRLETNADLPALHLSIPDDIPVFR